MIRDMILQGIIGLDIIFIGTLFSFYLYELKTTRKTRKLKGEDWMIWLTHITTDLAFSWVCTHYGLMFVSLVVLGLILFAHYCQIKLQREDLLRRSTKNSKKRLKVVWNLSIKNVSK